jgi:hypothetical protein
MLPATAPLKGEKEFRKAAAKLGQTFCAARNPQNEL